ncbi:hypothetical protein DMI70_06115 [Escherichia coli]|nr:hypothetical protein [Escherichia coli]
MVRWGSDFCSQAAERFHGDQRKRCYHHKSDTNGDLSTLAQLLSGFSGTAVGVVKGDWMALVQAVKTTPARTCSPRRVSPRWTN